MSRHNKIVRKAMKCLILLVSTSLAVGCSVLQSNPWDWLAESSEQEWRNVRVNAFGREIRFQVPDRKGTGGEHVRVWPPDAAEKTEDWSITVPFEALQDTRVPVAQFRWDEYWGGFYKSGDRDFTLNIQLLVTESNKDLLELTVDERVQRRMDYYRSVYTEAESPWTEYFFDRYWVKAYDTEHHIWIVENQPQVTWSHEYYLIPLSNRLELVLKFFVREKRWDFKDDPEWRESRWAIVRQIMDTVQITPSPFPDEP